MNHFIYTEDFAININEIQTINIGFHDNDLRIFLKHVSDECFTLCNELYSIESILWSIHKAKEQTFVKIYTKEEYKTTQ